MRYYEDDDDIWWRTMKARDRCSSLVDTLPDAVVDGPWYEIEWPLVERTDLIKNSLLSCIANVLQRNASH